MSWCVFSFFPTRCSLLRLIGSVAQMATKRKQFLINGKTYEQNKKRQFVNIKDKNDVLSRRQAIKALEGVTPERKAKERKAQGIPKGFKRSKNWGQNSQRKYYSKRVDTIAEVEEILENLPDNAISVITSHYKKDYPLLTRNTGESIAEFNKRKHLHLQQTVLPRGDSSFLLNKIHGKSLSKFKTKLANQGYHFEQWEIIFTFISNK